MGNIACPDIYLSESDISPAQNERVYHQTTSSYQLFGACKAPGTKSRNSQWKPVMPPEKGQYHRHHRRPVCMPAPELHIRHISDFYSIGALLGTGGSSQVYRARGIGCNSSVAVKVIRGGLVRSEIDQRHIEQEIAVLYCRQYCINTLSRNNTALCCMICADRCSVCCGIPTLCGCTRCSLTHWARCDNPAWRVHEPSEPL